jgi:hypothetical protein
VRISFNEIPGFRVALKRENDVRDAAFLDLTTDICGIPIRQMTARDLVILDGLDNPLVCGGLPTPEQLKQFLWLLSPGYRDRATIRRWLFNSRVNALGYLRPYRRCLEYVRDTFQDSPGGSAVQQRQYAGWCAHMVNAIAINYGWSEELIVGTEKTPGIPLKRLFQYLKCIRRYHDPQCPMHNPSDKLIGQYIRSKNAKLKQRS